MGILEITKKLLGNRLRIYKKVISEVINAGNVLTFREWKEVLNKEESK